MIRWSRMPAAVSLGIESAERSIKYLKKRLAVPTPSGSAFEFMSFIVPPSLQPEEFFSPVGRDGYGCGDVELVEATPAPLNMSGLFRALTCASFPDKAAGP